MKSLRRELFLSIVFFVIAVVIGIGILSIVQLYMSGLNAAHDFIKNANAAAAEVIKGYFRKFYVTIEFLSNIAEVRYAAYLGEEERSKVLQLYKLIQEADKDVNYLYSGYANGFLLINDYEPAEGFNPTVRPWYIAAVESKPNATGGIPYREFKTNELLFSVSKALLDEQGNVTGVIAIETSVERLLRAVSKSYERYRTAYTYVLRNDQTVIIHPNESYLSKKISEIVEGPINFENDSGSFEYELNHTRKIAYYSHIPELRWIVVTAVEKREVTKPVLINLGMVSLLFVSVSLFLGWFMSKWFSRRLIDPLLSLKEDVDRIVKGETSGSGTAPSYENNEIGLIAKQIYSLTERELYRRNQQLKTLNEELEKISVTDKLTGLFNRHKMDDELEKAFYLWKRYNRSFCLLMVDIDNFKGVNDTYGHQMGDAVLREFAEILTSSLRHSDVASKWGGEEFLILCPETRKDEALILAERIRSKVAERNFVAKLKITVSVGVCEVKDHNTIDALLSEADNNLYKAKQLGKNKVVDS